MRLYVTEKWIYTDEFGAFVVVDKIVSTIETTSMGTFPMIVSGGDGRLGLARVALGDDGHVYVKIPTVDYYDGGRWLDRTVQRVVWSRLVGRHVDPDGRPVKIVNGQPTDSVA